MATDYANKWWVSSNEEWFSDGPYDTPEDAVAEGLGVYGVDPFYIGRSVHLLDMRKPDVDALLERLDESLSDCTSFDGGPLIELSKADSDELAVLIENFLRERAQIRNFGIDETRKIDPLSLDQSPSATGNTP